MEERIRLQRRQSSQDTVSVFAPSSMTQRANPSPDSSQSPTTVPTIGHNLSQISILPPVQAKLSVSQPNDPYEQEADRVADQVMRMQAPESSGIGGGMAERIDRKCAECEKEEEDFVQAKSMIQRSGIGELQVDEDLESRLKQSKGGGSPLPDDVRSFMEPRFGVDFSQVRVHTDREAVQMNRELGAQAFVHEQDIYFGNGKAPAKDDLTAHELTHVVQQTTEQISSTAQTKAIQREEAESSDTTDQEANRSQLQAGACYNVDVPLDAPESIEIALDQAAVASNLDGASGDDAAVQTDPVPNPQVSIEPFHLSFSLNWDGPLLPIPQLQTRIASIDFLTDPSVSLQLDRDSANSSTLVPSSAILQPSVSVVSARIRNSAFQIAATLGAQLSASGVELSYGVQAQYTLTSQVSFQLAFDPSSLGKADLSSAPFILSTGVSF